jgi:uncharacterized phage-associated protein
LEHVRKVGLPVLDVEYQAWDKGPVIPELRDLVKKNVVSDRFNDFKNYFEIHDIKTNLENDAKLVEPKFDVDEDIFSENQIELLKTICEKNKYVGSPELIDKTHAENEPWHIVYEVRKEKNGVIDLSLGSDERTRELMKLHGYL